VEREAAHSKTQEQLVTKCHQTTNLEKSMTRGAILPEAKCKEQGGERGGPTEKHQNN